MEKTLRKFESLYTFECLNCTFIYNICDVIDFLELNDVDYFKSGTLIKAYADKYNLSLYSTPKEKFSILEAISRCEYEKTIGVIIEDLS